MIMKRLVFTVAMSIVIAGSSFGQKKAVNGAKSEAKADKPNFGEARTLIKGALENPETKNDPNTWYVAGDIENAEFDKLRTSKEFLKQTVDEKVMYDALYNVLPYFLVCDSLDQLPDEKGKVKPKFRKNMKSIIHANAQYLINGGAYYYENQDYPKAYNFFQQYISIPDLAMFKEDKEPVISKNDSTYKMIKFYSGIAASQMDDHQKAIAAYESLKNDDYRTNDVYQYLAGEYDLAKDSVNFIKVLKEGVEKFPDNSYFLLNLINQHIYSGKTDEAIVYLNKAIVQKPDDAQLYEVLGKIYESRNEVDKASENFRKSLSINPEYTEAIGDVGRIYYNQAVELQQKANDIADQKEYKEAIVKVKDLFQQALPYFEKVHKLDPDNREYKLALRGIYYSLDKGPELEAIEKELANP